MNEDINNIIKIIKISTSAIIFIFLFIVIIMGYEIVPTGKKGLIFNFGEIQNKELENGFYFKVPFYQKIRTISIQPIQLDHKVRVGNDGAITKDNQTIGADLTIFYKYKQGELVKMYREFGEEKINSITASSIRESFKGVIGNYDIFKLPISQEEIRLKVFEDIKNKLVIYPVEITEMKIMNYDWSDDFDKQIALTMERAQQVKQAEQDLLITEQQANKQVKEAEAEKNAKITKAEGDKESARLMAEAKALEGEGIKKYNESVATNWNIELKKMELEIEKIKADRWNGQYVPNNMYGPIPFDTQGGIKK